MVLLMWCCRWFYLCDVADVLLVLCCIDVFAGVVLYMVLLMWCCTDVFSSVMYRCFCWCDVVQMFLLVWCCTDVFASVTSMFFILLYKCLCWCDVVQMFFLWYHCLNVSAGMMLYRCFSCYNVISCNNLSVWCAIGMIFLFLWCCSDVFIYLMCCCNNIFCWCDVDLMFCRKHIIHWIVSCFINHFGVFIFFKRVWGSLLILQNISYPDR